MSTTLEREQIERVRASFNTLSPMGEEMTRIFFTRLFTAGPGVRSLFPRDAADRWQDVMASIGIVVNNLHRLDAIEHMLMEMGARNLRYGAQPQHYGQIRDALIQSMRDVLGPTWSAGLADDWTQSLNVVASYMLRGAGLARRAA